MQVILSVVSLVIRFINKSNLYDYLRIKGQDIPLQRQQVLEPVHAELYQLADITVSVGQEEPE